MREEIEVLYMRMVIRPIEQWQAKKSISTLNKKNSADSPDLAVQEIDDNFLAGIVERPDFKLDQSEKLQLNMHLNFITETLLGLSAEELGYFFLVYDCQPFSENLIQRSLCLLFKYNQSNLNRSLTLLSNLSQKLQSFNPQNTDEADRWISSV